MFRKVKKKSGLRRRRPESGDSVETGENNEGENDDDDVVTRAIQQTQKKQKILASLPLATGSATSDGSYKEWKALRGKQHLHQQQHQHQQQQSSSSPDMTELSILASKHKQNMEEYIATQIQATTASIKNNNNNNNNTMDNPNRQSEGIQEVEEDLYQQLSRETYRGENNNSLLASNQQQQQQEHRQDDDKGAGGTMLVGSGIAEVILPTKLRLSSAMGNIVRNKHTLSSSSAIPKGTKEVLPLTTPKPIGRSMVQQQSQQQQQPVHANSSHNFGNKDSNNDPPETSLINTPDSKRAGFDAIIRGRSTYASHGVESRSVGQSSSTSFLQKKRNRDDQAFSNFVNKQFDGSHRRF
jgi:hypothetical protein